jgi:hypothetical protein
VRQLFDISHYDFIREGGIDEDYYPPAHPCLENSWEESAIPSKSTYARIQDYAPHLGVVFNIDRPNISFAPVFELFNIEIGEAQHLGVVLTRRKASRENDEKLAQIEKELLHHS